jgi:hypothetical protein
LANLLLLITGILAGLTSLPLTYLAVHSHRELRHLRRSHHTLRELLVEVREDDRGPR